MFGAMIVAGVAWVVRSAPADGGLKKVTIRRARLVLLGAAWFLAGWLPVLVTFYPPDSRTRYWPCLGLMVVLAVVIEVASTSPASARQRLCTCVRAVLAIAMLAACVVLVGMQVAYRTRWLQDCSEAAQLRALVPSPAPFTLFQPVDVRSTGIRTGSTDLDTRFHAVWWYPWSTRKFVQEAYARDDISAMFRKGAEAPYIGGDERGLRYSVRLGPRYGEREGEGSRLPWDRLVPFIVDEAGRVRLVTEFVFPAPSGMGTIHVLQSAGAAPLEVRLPRR
jgi:hypothetical protein